MILRRFIQHLKEQNWFAVGLDVIVVIVGIFLGLQVTEWNEHRKMKANALASLSLLQQDIIASQQYLGEHMTYLNIRQEGLQAALDAKDSTEIDRDFVYGLYEGLFALQSLQLQMKTYEALSSSGQLSLIDNEDILMALAKIEVIYKSIQHGEEDTERFQHGIVDRYTMKNLDYSAYTNYDFSDKSSANRERIFPSSVEFRNIMQFQLDIVGIQVQRTKRMQEAFENLLTLIKNQT